jgi:acyl phosphate:glycerol-3-phosphate acyltransferase
MGSPVAVAGSLALGYPSGALPWGLWLGRALRGVDVRTLGSRNLGATNVYRSLGPALGITTLVLDIAKGALPVALVPGLAFARDFPGGREWCAVVVAAAAVAGHMWTCFAGFRGGKGVATTVGVLLALAPVAFAVFALVFVATVALTRYVSLGSVLGSLAFAAALARVAEGGVRSPTFAVGVVLALLVIVRHRENLGRLARGTERRFSLRGGSGSRLRSRCWARARGAPPWRSISPGSTTRCPCGTWTAPTWTGSWRSGRTGSFWLASRCPGVLRFDRNSRRRWPGPR